MNQFLVIDLKGFYSNKGLSFEKEMNKGNLTGVGSSFPAEYFPDSGTTILVNQIPFFINNEGPDSPDNMELNNQTITFKRNLYKFIHILGCSDNGSFKEPLILASNEFTVELKLGLTEWLEKEPLFGEKVGIKCGHIHSGVGKIYSFEPIVWHQTIKVDESVKWDRIKFIDNPGMHIFAITLEI